ncbi:MAG: phenylalanine--tRNA ligase subunit beta, partial [Salinisphaera sp.]|nr:phenylalanine--tRNA ligase subunit beta [Salinisphaera sp.]
MKFSERWLREWVDPPVDADRLCQQLTRAGLEVDAAEAAAPDLTGVVVGRITVCEPHPQADHLSVCRVDCGGHGQRSIVCGAPNAAVDLVAPVALPGAQLPTVGEIAETTLHGVTSQGMLCSAAELGLGEEGDRLLSLDPEAVPGTPLADHLGLPDRVIDIDLTPNRGDCLSLRGVAREVAVWNRLNFNHPDCSPLPAEHEQQRDVSIENLDQCSAYAGRVLIGTDTNARTPDWLRERLRRAGLRSLGVAVDVTNYVMLELGQPMHAFDLARLAGGIQVRQARAGESLRLLDETEVVLDPSTLVIADDDGPVAMAGVMGGAESAVSANTRDLFLESACFAPAAVAGLGRRCRVHSESLHRFERGVDPQLQQAAMERATALIQSIAGGACGPVTVAGGPRKATAAITL